MADQLSPDEKFNLITRNLQVGHAGSCSLLLEHTGHTHMFLLVCVCIAGGPWRGEGEAGPSGESAQGLLGHSNHWQTPRSLLCPHV